MAGNSSRRGATSKGKNKAAGSGGRIRRSLEGRGPTPKAEDRTYHKAYKQKQAAQRRQASQPKKSHRSAAGADWVSDDVTGSAGGICLCSTDQGARLLDAG